MGSLRPAAPGPRSLDGLWSFHPGPPAPGFDPRVDPGAEQVRVPGLWEAQGHLHLDGEAWYQRTVDLPSVEGRWSLHFGAVMDEAEVYVNGVACGRHVGGYTPFELDVTEHLVAGSNIVAVRVVDHPLDGADHVRTAHGKQGWMNHVFPSPPSLYMTYGGIWQPVSLVQHGPVRVTDLWVDGDPVRLRTTIELANRTGEAVTAHVLWQVGDVSGAMDVDLTAAEVRSIVVELPEPRLAWWSPGDPVLHEARVVVEVAGEVSDARAQRFGVRTVTLDGSRLLVNDMPVLVASALVQGFRGDTLYAEGPRDVIEQEVRAAKAAGFTMLRLHIKAFDPVYLDVCDELGMLVHCDIPVAEPIAHGELDDVGLVAERSVAAATEQVRRDRSHPCIVLWSAMNELGAEDPRSRYTAGYEAFARRMYHAVGAADPTRPVIENDWVEPDPERVFESPLLTAHWYGRLSARYLRELGAKLRSTGRRGGPFLLSEFGDWGLPQLEAPSGPEPFWWPHHLPVALEGLPWSADVARFVRGTQRYQGMADRLQIELARVTPGVTGWCLTELTDVPHEYNGLWQLDRTPKRAAIEQVSAAMRPLLPVVVPVGTDGEPSGTWSGRAGGSLRLLGVVVNDTGAAGEATFTVEVVGGGVTHLVVQVGAYRTTRCGLVAPELPATPGTGEIRVTLSGLGRDVVHSYPVHVVADEPVPGCRVEATGTTSTLRALAAAGMRSEPGAPDVGGPLVVGEGCLDEAAGALANAALAAGRSVLVLAQEAGAVRHLPVSARAVDIATEWGSTPFLFTGTGEVLGTVPPDEVLVTELLSVVPEVVLTEVAGSPWADRTVVGLYKPFPGELQGTVVGSQRVGPGRLWLCQLPVEGAAAAGDPTAIAVLRDLVAAASVLHPEGAVDARARA